MRRVLAACLLSALLLPLAGCWSRKEITEIAIIVAIGFDHEPGPEPYRITMQIARVSALVRGGAAQGQAKGEPVEVITGVGRTAHEAGRQLQRGMSRRFHPEHNEVWVIGEEMARRGIGPLMDFFERLQLVRPNVMVLIAKGSARDVLQQGENLERTLAETISGLMRFRTYTASTMRVTVNDVGVALSQPGRQPVIPGVRVDVAAVDKGEPMVMLKDLAIFKEDRLVGWLPPRSNLGFLWAVNKVSRGVVTLSCPDEPDRYVSVELSRGRSSRRAQLVGGRPVVAIHTDVEVDVTSQECKENLTTPEGFAKLAAAQEKFIAQAVTNAVDYAQGLKSDVFGFGELFYRSEPAYWKRVARRWDDEVFPRLDHRITVEVHPRRPGLITSPVPIEHPTEKGR